jgi:hypothetical protein
MSQHPSVTFLRLSAAARRGVAWLAVALLVFQSLVASAAFSAPAPVARGQGASVILCTASGPRVVALDAVPPGPQADISAHAHGGWDGGGTLPHCCASTCAMLGGACPPAPAGVRGWRTALAQCAGLAAAAVPRPSAGGLIAWREYGLKFVGLVP